MVAVPIHWTAQACSGQFVPQAQEKWVEIADSGYTLAGGLPINDRVPQGDAGGTGAG